MKSLGNISQNLKVEKINSLISVQSHNFLIEVFPKASLRERVYMDAWVRGVVLRDAYLFEAQHQWFCSFMSLLTEQDSALAFCSAGCGGVADSKIRFHLALY